jgi:tripartite ATP-independent transporter DctM subunit
MMTLLIIALLLFFISGAPLFSIMLATTALGTFSSKLGFEIGFDGAVNKLFGTSGRDEMEVLSTIPLFIYAGYVLAEAKTADRLVRFANAMLGWLPGGLAIVTIMTCALFTVFTGASGVTIIALGGVLMPALVRNGYPERFSMGLIAGTGSVGLLFPPALPLFIYGTVYGLNQSEAEKQAGTWATERFLFAGIVPGMVLVGMLVAVSVTVAIVKKLPRQKFAMGELGRSFLVALPELFIPFGVILGMATGFGLPEIAALTVVYVIILEVGVFRTINAKQMWNISYEAMAMIGAIFLIILASTALTDYVVNAHIPQKLVAWTQAHVSSKIVFLLAINVLLLIVGTMMDIFSAIVVVLPLIAPIARAYGIDPYHLGVIFLLNLEVGYLHPPVGLNLFLTSVKFQRPITEVMWATIPFLVTMIIALLVITYVPQLTITPPAKRTDRVMNLAEIVDHGVEESKVSIAEITLVDSTGKPIVNHDGKPIVRKFIDCRPSKPPTGPDGKPKPPSESEINNCQKLFLDVTECRPDAKSKDPAQLDCANRAIAKWTVERLNEDNPAQAAIVVTEVSLVDAAGAPLEIEEDVLDKNNQPVKDELDNTKKVTTKLVGADGKPITRKLAWCDTLEFSSDREKCRTLFIAASGCKISFEPATTECVDEKCPATGAPAGAGSATGSGSAAGSGSGSAGSGSAGSGSATAEKPAGDLTACKQAANASCVEAPIATCITDAVKSWVDDNPSIAKNPKLKVNGAKAVDVTEETSDGCSTTDGTSFGVLLVGATLIMLRRRRRTRTAA